MKKKLLIGAVTLVVLLVAAGAALILLIDVDRYRTDIEQAISAKTGRDVKVGRLHLKLFPATELRADGFTIGEDPRFGSVPFLKADRLFVRVKLWPLLSHRLLVDSLTIDAPKISLVSDRQGRWAYATLMEASKGGAGTPPGNAPRASGAPAGGGAGAKGGDGGGFTFSVHSLRITRGSVAVSGRAVKEIDLSVDDLSPGSIGGFDLSFLLPVPGSVKARLTGKSLSTSADRAEIRAFTASLGRSTLTGACTVSRFERPILDVRLASPLLDIDEVLAMFPSESASAAIRTAEDAPVVVPARQEGTPSAAGPSLLRDMTVRGDLSAEKIKVMNLSLASAKAKLTMERGEARLSGIGVNLYKGSLAGQLSAGVVEAGPPFSLSANLKSVDFNALATDLSKDLKGLIYGTLELGLDVSGRGLDTPGLRRNLKGTGSLALRDGKLTSIAALKMLAKALKSAGGKGVGEDETPFTSLTGTFDIRDGRLRTTDLALDSPDIGMDGQGAIGLDMSLDLDLGAKISAPVSADMIAKTPNLRYLQDNKGRLELDLSLGGTLMAPSVGIDPAMLERAARKAGKEELQKHGQDLLDKLLKKKN